MAATAVGVAVAGIWSGITLSGGGQVRSSATQAGALTTGTVERGTLSEAVSQDGILAYRAQPDGSAYIVFNRAGGTYTALPAVGDDIACGQVLYKVDERPVLLLCGPIPAYRSLSVGDSGSDVAELNANLVRLGYATHDQLDPGSHAFSAATASALAKLQAKVGQPASGSLDLGQAVFLPGSARIAKVTAQVGSSAAPGSSVMQATSDILGVELSLDPSQEGAVKRGDPAQITLPDNSSVAGKVDRLGSVTEIPAGQNGNTNSVAIPVYISLGDPAKARGLDQAPVQVQITTAGVDNALSVPATAIVGKSGGGLAVEVVGADGRRDLVPVKLGLFDTAAGRVQVDGELRPGERVVVPSS